MPSKRPAAPRKTTAKPAAKPAVKRVTKSATKPVLAKTALTSGTRSASKRGIATRGPASRTVKSAAAAIAPLSHHDIAARAHDLYVESGFQSHREVEFWLEAERQLKRGIKL